MMETEPMAKITLTLSDLAPLGPISGTITSHRKDTRFIRERYTDDQETDAQRVVRNAFNETDIGWHRLSEANQQAWNTWRRWKYRTGFHAYRSVNIKRLIAGLPPIDNPATL